MEISSLDKDGPGIFSTLKAESMNYDQLAQLKHKTLGVKMDLEDFREGRWQAYQDLRQGRVACRLTNKCPRSGDKYIRWLDQRIADVDQFYWYLCDLQANLALTLEDSD